MRYGYWGGLGLAAAILASVGARAADDPAAGKTIFARTCATCHSTDIGVNKVGPTLYHVVGRKSATIPDYNYSPAMKGADKVWTEAELNEYLSNPRSTMHGVKMYFKGLPDPQDRADVIAYLKTLQ